MLVSSLVTLTACGSNPGEDACEAFVESYSKRYADDCALATRAAVRASIFASFASLGVDQCSDFTKVRDEASFYDECLPGIEAQTCTEIAGSALPTSCNMQLQVVR